MTARGKLLLAVGVIAAAVAALLLGVSPNTILLVGAVLLCPAAMYFGMSGMGAHGGGGHSAKCEHGDARGASENAEGGKRQKAA